MDFFEEQERSRRRSRWLVLWYAAALVATVGLYCLALMLVYPFLAIYGAPLAGDAPLQWDGLWGTYLAAFRRVPPQLIGAVALVATGGILAASAWRMWQLADGGFAVAELLYASYVEPGKCTPAERRLLNVVEELAIASGVCVPPVYILRSESAINALVAGHSPNEAVIIVTQGAAEKLSRDELQGVMGHEFSHILNGDMALNLRLVSLLAGLTWVAEAGERMVYRAGRHNMALPREERGEGVLEALAGALAALIGFPGTLAASAIKAAISREREFLADAASVQFTRNPEAIAGALDSILALRAHTTVLALHCAPLAHMFFAPAVASWWSFPTHPPIRDRIERVHPNFMREDYRATRHGARREVAVLDGLGNVVKHAAFFASVGRPRPRHVDYAAQLLQRLPSRLQQALRRPEEAEAAMFALAAGPQATGRAAELHPYIESVGRSHMLTLAELAVPAIKAQRQSRRDAFLGELLALIESDQRVTLSEFVLFTLLRQHLREGAGQPIRTQFRSVEELADSAQVVLSLIAHVSGPHATAAFGRGAAVLRLEAHGPLGASALSAPRVAEALERLRLLSPFAKPAVLKACVEAASGGGTMPLAEAELVRMVAATLDCPVPPVVVVPHDAERLAA